MHRDEKKNLKEEKMILVIWFHYNLKFVRWIIQMIDQQKASCQFI